MKRAMVDSDETTWSSGNREDVNQGSETDTSWGAIARGSGGDASWRGTAQGSGDDASWRGTTQGSGDGLSWGGIAKGAGIGDDISQNVAAYGSREDASQGGVVQSSGRRDYTSCGGDLSRGGITCSNMEGTNQDGIIQGSGNGDDTSQGDITRGSASADNTRWKDGSRGSSNRDDLSRVSFNRGVTNWGDSSNRDNTSWGGVTQDSGNRDDTKWGGVTQDSSNRDDTRWGGVTQDSSNRDETRWGGVTQDSSNRDATRWGGVTQDSSNRDDTSWGGVTHDSSNRDDTSWDGVTQDSSNRDDTSWGGVIQDRSNSDDPSSGGVIQDSSNRDDTNWGGVTQDSSNRDDINWGDLNRASSNRDALNQSGNTQSYRDKNDLSLNNKDRENMTRGSMNRDNVSWGHTNQDYITRDNVKRNDVRRGHMTRGVSSRGKVNMGDFSHNTKKDYMTWGNMSRGDLNRRGFNQGDTDGVYCSDLNKRNAKKLHKPEDDKGTFFCDICQLTCASFMNYQSHIWGTKHLKRAGISESTKKFRKPRKTLKDYMDEPVRDPLIGLEYVIEYRLKGSSHPNYSCELCGFRRELARMIEHLSGFKHRKAYISKDFPSLLKVENFPNEDKIQLFRRMAAELERREGLQMYRIDLRSEKAELKSLLEIKPEEISTKSRLPNFVPNDEQLKMKALQSVDAYEIDCDSEALSVMTLTQDLTENLKAYCLNVKAETEHTEKVPSVKTVAETLSSVKPGQHTELQDSFGVDPYPSESSSVVPTVSRSWNLDPIHLDQKNPYVSEIKNLSLEPICQKQPSLGRGRWNEKAIAQNPLPQRAQCGVVTDDWSHAQARKTAQGTTEKGNYKLIKFAPIKPRGPGGVPSGNCGFGTRSSRFDSRPLPGNISGGPSRLLSQPNGLQKSNLSATGLSRVLDAPNLSAGPEKLAANIDIQERIGNVGYSEFLPPNADCMPTGTSPSMVLPRALAAEKTDKKASPLTAEILNRIRGKDVQSASVILLSLAAANPELQKVNMSNLLNLLVQTGAIK